MVQNVFLLQNQKIYTNILSWREFIIDCLFCLFWGLSLKDAATPGILGYVAKATISKENTVLLEGRGSEDDLNDRCEQIRDLIESKS